MLSSSTVVGRHSAPPQHLFARVLHRPSVVMQALNVSANSHRKGAAWCSPAASPLQARRKGEMHDLYEASSPHRAAVESSVQMLPMGGCDVTDHTTTTFRLDFPKRPYATRLPSACSVAFLTCACCCCRSTVITRPHFSMRRVRCECAFARVLQFHAKRVEDMLAFASLSSFCARVDACAQC